MDSTLSEQQEMLLFKACKDLDGIITRDLAERMYSSKSSAKSAIKKLELFDYIELTSPGHWRVVKLPNDVKRELKSFQGSGSEQDAPENREESSDFKIEA